MQFSPQQLAVFHAIQNDSDSLIVEAVAGSGKTTTLVRICEIVAQLFPRHSVAFAAYNKAIATEIGAKLLAAIGANRNIRSGTFHSFGFAAIRRAFPDVKVDKDGKKWAQIVKLEEIDDEYQAFVRTLVSLAKQAAVGVLCAFEDLSTWQALVDRHDLHEKLVEEDGEDDGITLEMRVAQGIQMALRCLRRSVSMDRVIIDFDDMLYAPLVHNLRMWQNDLVLIDEGQDTNPARRALARKMLRPGGRLVAVGDRHQAIYGFTGADSDALDLIASEFNARRLPLTVTYRCPKAVVDVAHRWVSHIEAHETAPQGSVRSVELGDFLKLPATEFTYLDAILCRNTKPIVEMAFTLLRRGIPCHVEGRAIGEGLIQLSRRWKSATTAGELRERLREYRQREMERLMARGQEQKAGLLDDRVATLLVVMEDVPDDEGLQMVWQRLNTLFQDTEEGEPPKGVTLSTIHRAKGREWQRVWWLGLNRYQPSPFARQAWQAEQEDNLCYVAATRAKRELVFVNVPYEARRRR